MRLVDPLTIEQRSAFLAAARGFMRARWRHQGRLPSIMDCLGLVVLSFAAIGIVTQDRKGYGRTPYNRQLRATLTQHFGQSHGPSELQPADIVTLKWTGEENHLAIITDHPEGLGMIHCWAMAPGAPDGGGRVVEHRMSPDWLARVVEGWRP